MGTEATAKRPREVLLPAWGLKKGFPHDWIALKWELKDDQAEGAV